MNNKKIIIAMIVAFGCGVAKSMMTEEELQARLDELRTTKPETAINTTRLVAMGGVGEAEKQAALDEWLKKIAAERPPSMPKKTKKTSKLN